jgi:hypothetical protein
MNKLNMRGVESNAGNSPFGGLGRMIFSVADDRMADGGELRPDLILQSGYERYPDQRGAGKRPLDGISEFCASRFGIFFRALFLKHSHTPKIVDQSPLFGAETPAKDRQILPYRRMIEKLPNQDLPVMLRFGEKQNTRRETIDAVDHQGSLPLPGESCREQRQSGRPFRTFDRHGSQAGRLIKNHHGIVLIEHIRLG